MTAVMRMENESDETERHVLENKQANDWRCKFWGKLVRIKSIGAIGYAQGMECDYDRVGSVENWRILGVKYDVNCTPSRFTITSDELNSLAVDELQAKLSEGRKHLVVHKDVDASELELISN